MTGSGVALSVKQPWAALLAAGVKTVEVRTWPTSRRGTVFLHAAKVPDDRPHGWALVEAHQLADEAARGGGIVAVAELVDCVTYFAAAAFAADAHRHRNHPSWFRPPTLYGFLFADIRPVPFHAVTGQTFFFPVSGIDLGERGGAAPCLRPAVEGTGGLRPPLAKNTGVTLPPPAGPVIIIDPPEGKEARHHDHPPDTRPPG